MNPLSRWLARYHGIRATLDGMRRLGLSPWSPLIIFDVGANDGRSFLPAARVFTQWKVLAFEPTPHLLGPLRHRARGLKNYHIIPKAIGETEGKMIFNIAGLGDSGCSSLLEFSEDRAAKWQGREDLEVTDRIEVEVTRLDRHLHETGIDHIDYLHVDTQGTDLSVLRSLGSRLTSVRAGVIEVPASPEMRLYQGQHTKEEALQFLAKHGFEVCETEHQYNEDNLYFRRIS